MTFYVYVCIYYLLFSANVIKFVMNPAGKWVPTVLIEGTAYR